MTASSKVRVSAFCISLDGYGAALGQDEKNPFGVGGLVLPAWLFPTKAFQSMHGDGKTGGSTGVDNDFVEKSMQGVGAWILGRNMFGPVRGPWEGDAWKGWWGPNPPYHSRVFVLTHHARPALEMEGGTTFIFVTDGIESALKQAREAAGGRDVRIGGGVSTVRQYLKAGLIDEMQLAFVPVLLGQGESLLEGLSLPKLGFQVAEHQMGERAMHLVLRRRG
jgi:dihydrofolate reductase